MSALHALKTAHGTAATPDAAHTQAAVGDRPPPEAQRELVARACAAPATTTILVDAQFLAQWRLHTSRKGGAPAPASMDNRAAARRDAVWWRDFECVPPAAYDLLVKWYGGGPRVARPVAAGGHVLDTVARPCAEPVDAACGGPSPCRRRGCRVSSHLSLSDEWPLYLYYDCHSRAGKWDVPIYWCYAR